MTVRIIVPNPPCEGGVYCTKFRSILETFLCFGVRAGQENPECHYRTLDRKREIKQEEKK